MHGLRTLTIFYGCQRLPVFTGIWLRTAARGTSRYLDLSSLSI